jgi:hypothetical protein
VLPTFFWLLYLVLMIVGFGLAMGLGGATEKLGAVLLAGGSLLTPLAMLAWGQMWRAPQGGVLVVDGILAIAFTGMALASDRYWPIWAAAMMWADVLVHVARFLQPGAVPYGAYAAAAQLWGYLLWVVIGTAAVLRWRQSGSSLRDRIRRNLSPALAG